MFHFREFRYSFFFFKSVSLLLPLRVQKDLLFCQVVRLSFSNLPQQLAFPDVNVDAVSIISFLRRQKIADVFFSFSLKFERKTSDLPT